MPNTKNTLLYRWYKYFHMNYKAFTAYRFNTVSYLLTQVVTLVGTMTIWYYSISNGATGISLSEIITYYIVGQLVILQLSPHWSIAEDIQTGNFSNKLLRPEGVWLSYLVEDLGVQFFTNFVKIILSGCLIIIFFPYIFKPSNLFVIALFICSIIIAYAIELMISYISSFLTFYTINSRGILELFGQIKSFCSGWFFPLNLVWFTRPLLYLPFAFTYYYPMQIYLEKYSIQDSLLILGYGVGVAVILFLVASWIYRDGLRRYESVGL
jgi:ABC-2 type transport system permease protein